MYLTLSIAYVNGFKLAITCNQEGINDSGAKAVLENNVGKLIIKIKAKNSMCPGKVKPRYILILAVLNVIKVIIQIIINKLIKLILYCVIVMLNINILRVCVIATVVIKNIEEIIKESFEMTGEASILFRNPNSLSNIIGKPALIAPLKDVNTIIPGLKKIPYFKLFIKKPVGAF